MRKIFICSLLFSILLNKAFAKPGDVIISGTSNTPLNVEVIQFPPYFITPDREYQRYHTKVTGTVFNLHIPGIKNPTYLFIRMLGRDTVYNLAYYLVEGGDSVHIDARKDSLVFSGKAGASFTCQYLLKKPVPRIKGYALSSITDLYKNSVMVSMFFDSLNKIKLNILSACHSRISEQVYSILWADCIGEHKARLYANIDFNMMFVKDSLRPQEARYYYDYFANEQTDTAQATRLAYSRFWIDYLLIKAKVDRLMQLGNLSRWADMYNVSTALESIKNKYTGILQERLLTQFFATQKRYVDSNYRYLHQVAIQVKDPFLQSVLTEVGRKSQGVPAYPFSLPDSSGKLVKLSDFKGRVVIMDFWYTGCTFCESLAKKIKPTIDSLKDDPRFAFLTVSIDRDKERWKKSLCEGKYTSDGEINLYTNGQGGEHDFIEYYRINNYPQVFIIDSKGKIFSVNPQRNKAGKFQLKSIIEKALLH